MIPPQIPMNVRDRARSIVMTCLAKAEAFYKRKYNVPTIRFDLRGRTGGVASGDHTVNFNAILMMENLQEYYEQVIPHEVAHCIDVANGNTRRFGAVTFTRNGRMRAAKRSIHGDSWKQVMRVIGARDVDDARCHTMDTSNARVRVKAIYEYKCNSCDARMFFSIVRHRKQQTYIAANPGKTNYWCRKCGKVHGALVFVDINRQGTSTAPVPVKPPTREVPIRDIIDVKSVPPQGYTERPMFVAKTIMQKYGYQLTRQQFIIRAVEAGLKATTASTYYNSLKRSS